MHFQEYWIRHHAGVPAHAVVPIGIEDSKPAPGVLDAISGADLVLVPPSNPVVSVGTILGVPGIRDALASTAAPVVGVSGIIGADHVHGMARQLLGVIGVEVSAAGVAEHYGARSAGGLLDGWLVDTVDEGLVERVTAAGIRCRAVPLWMTDHDATADMVAAALEHRAMTHLQAWGVEGIGEITEGTDLGAVLAGSSCSDGDIVLVTSKVVSKAEGRVRPGDRDEAIRDETVRVVARRGPTTIVENHLGMVMAAAGVDASNVAPGYVVLLPTDPDATARALRERVHDADRPERGGGRHRHRRASLAHRPDRPRGGRRRARATRRPRREERLLREPTGRDGAGRRGRARLRGRAGHRQARRTSGVRGARARRSGAARRRPRTGGPGADPAPRARTCSPSVHARQ